MRTSRPALCTSDLPAEVVAWLPSAFALEPLPEGDPADTALARGPGGACVIKCARGLPDSEWITIEARALRALSASELPVPRVVGVRPAKSDDDAAWLVTTALPGRPLSRVLEATDGSIREAWCARLGRMLAWIHGTPIPEELRDVDATPWERRRHEAPPRDEADRALASRRLADIPPPPRVLVHGDFTIDNVLAGDDAITGVIDWPGAGTGDPRFDVALALLSIPQSDDDAASSFMRAYVDELRTRHAALHAHIVATAAL